MAQRALVGRRHDQEGEKPGLNERDRRPRRAPEPPPLAPRERYFNRELSWLAFNRRVLEEACNPAHPAARAASLPLHLGKQPRRILHGPGRRAEGASGCSGSRNASADGLTPAQQLAAVAAEADELTQSQQQVWTELRRRARRGRRRGDRQRRDSTPNRREWLERHFREQIFPVLTPQAIDPAHPFPFIPNTGFSLIFDLQRTGGRRADPRAADGAVDPAALHPPARGGGALHRRSRRSSGATSPPCSPATSWSAAAPSGSSATATSRSRRKPRTSSATSGAPSSAAAAAGSSA